MAEPKTAAYWQARGWAFVKRSVCPGCLARVEIWLTPGKKPLLGREVPLNPDNYETHWSSCRGAQKVRSEERFKAGVI